ncbi:MAG: 4-(cytidine 5'-diphospho)-2-C-methyl-D-erythritol kinase [Sphaerochaetaceae bacterium]
MVMLPPRHISAPAYAKVNLHLWVGPRRDDGFHPIASIFQLIDLADTVSLALRPDPDLTIRCNVLQGVDPEHNTMVTAARLFCEQTGRIGTVDIACEKHIPLQAGLGGGSSDAATVLRLLNDSCGNPLDQQSLLELGARVGSDVPFFLGSSAVAYVQGRGELLEPLQAREDLLALVVMPVGKGVSTARAFADLDALRAQDRLGITQTPDRAFLAARYTQKVSEWDFFNNFRPVMGDLAPLYDQLDALVAQTGDSFGTVSGSGASYCIVSESRRTIGIIKTKIERISHYVCLYCIKCLHRGHSGDTVSI